MEESLYKRIGIYGIVNNVNGNVYVGQTKMNFGDRRDTHFSELNNNKHYNTHLQHAWNKYGKENFSFVVLHDLQEGEDIDELEKRFIKEYKNKGMSYNVSPGGNAPNIGTHLSEETKKKIGEKNRINSTGRKQSEETKAKHSRSMKAYYAKMSDDEKDILRKRTHDRFIGTHRTFEQRMEMHERQKTKPNSAKYSLEQVREIRRLHEELNLTYTEISKKMDIPRPAVYEIATYKRWKYA